MPKYTVREYSNLYRKANPELEDLDDVDVMQIISKQDPELLSGVERDELAHVMSQSRQKKISQARQKQFRTLSGLSRFGVGVGKGALDIFQGMHQIGLAGNEAGGLMGMGGVPEAETAEQYTKRTEASKQPYEDASKGDFASGLGEVAGQIATTAPVAGIVSPLGPVAAGVAEGAAVGATQFVPEGGSRGTQTAFGALLGAGTAYGAGLLKKLGTKGYNMVKNRFADASLEELETLTKAFDWPELTRGDITGDAGVRKAEVIAESKPLGLEKLREKGIKKLTKSVNDAVNRFKTDQKGTVGSQIQRSVKRGHGAARAQAKANYDEVKSLAGDVTVMPDNALNIARQHEAEIAEGVLSGDKSQFTTIIGNLEKAEKNFEQLRKIRSELGKASRAAYKGGEDDVGRRLKEIRQGIEYDIDDLVKGKVKGQVEPTAEDMKQYKEIWDYSDTEERLAGYHEYLESIEDAAKYDEYMGKIEIMSSKDAPNILRMANFVKMMDGKRIKGSKAGQTYDEHIPQGIFGEGSDVIADRLGMSEDDFMQMLIEMPRKPARAIPKVTKNTESIGIKPEELKQTTPPNPKVIKAYKKANKHYRENVLPYKTNKTLKKAMDTDEPDKLINALIGEDLGDRARIVYKALDDKGRASVRYGIMQNARRKALTEVPQGELISPVKFASYLDKANDVKNVFFDVEGKKYLRGLKKLLKASPRFFQYAENPPTGNRLNITNLKREAWLTLGLSPVKTLVDKFFWTGPGKKFILSAADLDLGGRKMGNLIEGLVEQFDKQAGQVGAEVVLETVE